METSLPEAGRPVVLPTPAMNEQGRVFALRDVGFSYATARHQPIPVLKGITLELQQGETVVMLGPSGCGKSTLLSIAAGLIHPSSGEVVVDGQPSAGVPGRCGYMMQRDELFAWRTVLRNVLLGPEILSRRITEAELQRAHHLLEVAGLSGFEDHYPSALSGGMRQRVAFVRTLMMRRPIVLLDEPFGALDAITRADMQEWLLRVRDELDLTLLLVTHDVDEAIFLADRVLVLAGRPSSVTLTRDVPFGRPRDYETVIADSRFGELKSALLHAIRTER